jgi:hypothetical protein
MSQVAGVHQQQAQQLMPHNLHKTKEKKRNKNLQLHSPIKTHEQLKLHLDLLQLLRSWPRYKILLDLDWLLLQNLQD